MTFNQNQEYLSTKDNLLWNYLFIVVIFVFFFQFCSTKTCDQYLSQISSSLTDSAQLPLDVLSSFLQAGRLAQRMT